MYGDGRAEDLTLTVSGAGEQTGLEVPAPEVVHSSMTNTITIRLRRPKREIEAHAKPNVNAWVNDLIERALGPRRADWAEHFARRAQRQPVDYCSDEIRKAGR